MDIVVWLRSLGLEKYEAAFREKKIAPTAAAHVTSLATLAAIRRGLGPPRDVAIRQRRDRLQPLRLSKQKELWCPPIAFRIR